MKKEIRKGVLAGIPIFIGFIPIAIAFGILAKATGIDMITSFLFSALVFAGASQFIALNLISVGAGVGEIILTTLLVNFRHFLMSSSLATKMDEDSKKFIPLIAFGITDEIFSVASFIEGKISKDYILPLQFIAYLGWVGGTVLGYVLGSLLPNVVAESMGVSLYAMFIAILIPEAKKSTKVLSMALLSGIINSILTHFDVFPAGWNIIIAIVSVSLLGVFIFDENKNVERVSEGV